MINQPAKVRRNSLTTVTTPEKSVKAIKIDSLDHFSVKSVTNNNGNEKRTK